MIVADFIVPLDCSAASLAFMDGSLAATATFCSGTEMFDSLPKGSLALIFADDSNKPSISTSVVQALGNLFPSWSENRIIVLGNLIVSDNEDYNVQTLSDLLQQLLRNGNLPILFSNNQAYAATYSKSLSEALPVSSLSIITPSANFANVDGSASVLGYVTQQAALQFSQISLLGTQEYFSSPIDAIKLEDYCLQKLRLGAMRSSMKLAEPYLRDSNLLVADMSALRHSDFKMSHAPSPNGLYAEEICQLLRYAGFSDSLHGLMVTGYNASESTPADTMLLAQMLWHFIEGYENRKQEIPGIVNFPVKEFYVELGDQNPVTLDFIQSIATERWWLFIPKGIDGGFWISCDEEDYDKVKHHELPLRWIFAQKINNKWNQGKTFE